jgi:hypothetical protein
MSRFTNYYECPECNYEWQDEWDCACDDDCPNCGLTCSPCDTDEPEDDDDE